MDTWVQLYRGGLVPLEQFAAMPYDRDLLVRVIVYKRLGRFAYQAMRNPAHRHPGAELRLFPDGGRLPGGGGGPPRQGHRPAGRGRPAGRRTSPRSAPAPFAQWAAERTPTGSNSRGSAAYRTHLVKVLVRRAAEEAGGNA